MNVHQLRAGGVDGHLGSSPEKVILHLCSWQPNSFLSISGIACSSQLRRLRPSPESCPERLQTVTISQLCGPSDEAPGHTADFALDLERGSTGVNGTVRPHSQLTTVRATCRKSREYLQLVFKQQWIRIKEQYLTSLAHKYAI